MYVFTCLLQSFFNVGKSGNQFLIRRVERQFWINDVMTTEVIYKKKHIAPIIFNISRMTGLNSSINFFDFLVQFVPNIFYIIPIKANFTCLFLQFIRLNK